MSTLFELFHNQVVFHRFDALNAASDLACPSDILCRIDKTAQLDFPLNVSTLIWSTFSDESSKIAALTLP